MSKKILGISGGRGSGKTTATEILLKLGDWKEIAFADNLKDMCAKCFGHYRSIYEDPDLEDKDFEDPIKFTLDHLRYIHDWITIKTSDVAVDSIGYKVAASRYFFNNDSVILLRNPRQYDGHRSEQELDLGDYDGLIENDRTEGLKVLEGKVTSVIHHMWR